jgi:cysteine synthase A
MAISENILDLIGNTPIVKLKKISKDLPGEIWAKLEFMNPSGSVKDRIALRMLEAAERESRIKPGATIVEPTSGNTGVALAMVCAVKGYRLIAVMPAAMSEERRKIMEFFGAKVELVPTRDNIPGVFAKEDIENTMARAKEIQASTPNSFMPNQFCNPVNPLAHAETTAEEIVTETGGRLHAFVAACGTGGTFSGVARILKERFPNVKNVVVEPATAAVISGDEPGTHIQQGIGEGFIPDVMDTSLADGIAKVSDEDAINMARRLAREEGILTGFSGGANVAAAVTEAAQAPEGGVVLTLIPDNAFRYLSTELLEK